MSIIHTTHQRKGENKSNLHHLPPQFIPLFPISLGGSKYPGGEALLLKSVLGVVSPYGIERFVKRKSNKNLSSETTAVVVLLPTGK